MYFSSITDKSDAISAYRAFKKLGLKEMAFDLGTRREGQERLDSIICLIKDMDSFNDKDSGLIGRTFKRFFDSLPRTFYQEGNPNNGGPVFTEIVLQRDDCIMLKGSDSHDRMAQYDWTAVEQEVRETGRKWNADEADLYTEEHGYLLEYIIRFWWD